MNGQTLTAVLSLIILVILSAYFSATETAFSTLNKTRMKTLAEKGNRKARLVIKLCDKYDELLSTILIGNNIVNIAMASIGTVLFVRLYGDVGATISTAVITVVVLIFGEISPKSMAKDSPESFTLFSAPIINILITVFTPLNFLFSRWKRLISKITRGSSREKTTQDELLMFVEEVKQEGSIDQNESDLLRNVIEFNDLDAEDILTHRVDLEAVSIDASKEEIAQVFSETKYSRLLVFDGNIDNIIGVVHQKNFYIGTGVTDKPLSEIITTPLFVPKSDKISNLLRRLQMNKSHLAVIVDEYGGTLGIVTLEDVLEELVGEIWDEHDEIVEPIKKIGDNTYLIDCSLDFDKLCEQFNIEFETDSTSISGWVMEMLAKIPAIGDSFTYENMTVTVKDTDSRRVLSVEIIYNPQEQETEE